MARPLRIAYPGAFYHVTSRGNERKGIFKGQRDREKFLSYLESATERYGARIHVFCLMSNHYHLLLETPLGNISQIMRHVNGAYTTYFNVKHRRAGHLFQGRYKAILVDIDAYAKELSRYIHLNPVKAKVIDSPEKYHWSSYQYYIGCKKSPEWLVRDFILGYFGNECLEAQREYRAFVEEASRSDGKNPLDEVVCSTILGRADFVENVQSKYLSNQKIDPNIPAQKELSLKPLIHELCREVDSVFGEDQRVVRGVAIYLCCKYTGEKLKKIGRHFGIGASGVSQASRRVVLRMEQDSALREKIKVVEDKLRMSCQQ